MSVELFLNKKSQYYFILDQRNIYINETWWTEYQSKTHDSDCHLQMWCSYDDISKLILSTSVSILFTQTDDKGNPLFSVLYKDSTTDIENFIKIPVRQFCYINPDYAAITWRAKSLAEFYLNYKFCPKCGSELEFSKLTAKFCPKCTTDIFPRISPAVITVIKKDKKILLAKHKNRNQNLWACIAGFVESGESIENAVRREVKEETGLEIKNLRYIKSQSWPFPDQLMFAFTADYAGGTIRLQQDELTDARWFDLSSLPDIPPEGSVAFDLIQTVLNE